MVSIYSNNLWAAEVYGFTLSVASTLCIRIAVSIGKGTAC